MGTSLEEDMDIEFLQSSVQENNVTTTTAKSTFSKLFSYSRIKDEFGGDEFEFEDDISEATEGDEDEDEDEGEDEEIGEWGCFNSVVANVPPGMEIDWCPNGSIRQDRINKLVADYEFVNKFTEEDDSDVSVDLDELESPIKIYKFMQSASVSCRREQIQRTMSFMDEREAWTETLVSAKKVLSGKEKPKDNDLKQLEKLTHKKKGFQLVKENNRCTNIQMDIFSDVPFHIVDGTTFNKPKKLLPKKRPNKK